MKKKVEKTMKSTLYLGFKGYNNSSEILVNSLPGQHSLLTNSFTGLKKDIDNLIEDYEEVYLFGVDKSLSDSFRIEQYAEKEGKQLVTMLDINEIVNRLSASGIKCTVSKKVTHDFCNEAYWHLLAKYKGRAVLIHIPTIKHFSEITPFVFEGRN